MKVLIAEDEPVTQTSLRRTVASFGFEAEAVGDGAAAWRRILVGDISILLTDWNMPGEDGLSLCRRIRDASLGHYVYIVMLTQRTAREDLLEGLAAGADDFIRKPFDPDELRVRLLVGERIVLLDRRLRGANEALRQYAAELDQKSKIDPLLGIGNRAAFEDRLRDLHSWARSSRTSFGVVMCDVDHFKVFNDTLGHQRGDEILRRIATAVRGGIRASDQAFRYGGEEIVLLLPDVGVDGAARVAERVREAVESARFEFEGVEAPFGVTVSCGAGAYPDDAADALDFEGPVERADRALYLAKHRGRNRVVRSDELPAETAAERPESVGSLQ